MADRILSPSKYTADAVVFLADLLKLMGNQSMADKSAKVLIKAAEDLAEAHGGVQALGEARRVLAVAEGKLIEATAEADGVFAATQKKIADAEDANEKERGEVEKLRQTSRQTREKLNAKEAKIIAREDAVLAREAACADAESTISDKVAEAEGALQQAIGREETADRISSEFTEKIKLLKQVVGNDG